MASSSRKRKRDTYTLTGSQLREAIKKTYFQNFNDYFEGLMRGRARHQTSRRKFAFFNEQVNEKDRELRKEIYEDEKKLNTQKTIFKRLKKRIEVPCDDEGGLSEDGYGGGQYDFFIYDYFFQNFKENVTIYVVDLREKFDKELLGDGIIDFSKDEDAKPNFSDKKKLKPAMFGTTPNPDSIIREIEAGPGEKKNLFLRLRGNHYEVLRVRQGVTEQELNVFQGATKEKKVRENWEKYFNVVRPKITPDGMCYWNAVAKAFEMPTVVLIKESIDLTDENFSALKF